MDGTLQKAWFALIRSEPKMRLNKACIKGAAAINAAKKEAKGDAEEGGGQEAPRHVSQKAPPRVPAHDLDTRRQPLRAARARQPLLTGRARCVLFFTLTSVNDML